MKNKGLFSLFLPGRHNYYRARLLHLPVLAMMVFVFLLFHTSFSLLALSHPAVLGYSSEITPAKIIELTNKEREKNGLSLLKNNSLLNEAARRKAADMFAFDYWAHESPTGRKPWDFFKEVHYDYVYAGENLARDFYRSEAVVAAWMASPTHRENILNGKYQEIGVAVVDGVLNGVETTLVVQLFGTPVGAKMGTQSKDELGEIVSEKEQEVKAPAVFKSSLSESDKMKGEKNKKPRLNPLSLLKTLAIFILGMLMGALIGDGLVVRKKRWARLSGDNFAHISFLLFVMTVVWLVKSGTII